MKDTTNHYRKALFSYKKCDDYDGAISVLEKLVNMFPGNVDYLLDLGSMLVCAKKFNDAFELLDPIKHYFKLNGRSDEYCSILLILFSAQNHDYNIGIDLYNLYLDKMKYDKAFTIINLLL